MYFAEIGCFYPVSDSSEFNNHGNPIAQMNLPESLSSTYFRLFKYEYILLFIGVVIETHSRWLRALKLDVNLF